MRSKKTVLAAVLTLMLALSIVTVSATAASANVKKSGEPVNNPCIAAADVSGECAGRPLEGFSTMRLCNIPWNTRCGSMAAEHSVRLLR